MKQLLILLLFIPGLAFAQQIKPVNGVSHEVRTAGNVTFVTQLGWSGGEKVYPISGTTVVYKGEASYADIVASGVVGNSFDPIVLTSTGDGSGVALFKVQVSEETVFTLDGAGKFYSNDAGDADESSTWTVSTTGSLQTRYIKVTSGTSNLTIDKPLAVTKLGNGSTTGWDGVGSDTNAPTMTATNWSQCTNLTNLTANSCNLTGSVAEWSVLTKLTYLRCNSTSVSGDVSGWSALTDLTYLNCYSTSISGDVSGWSALTKLTNLYCNTTSVSGDVSGWSALTKLTYLRCYSTSVSGDVSGWSALTNLTYLNCNSTSVSGDVSSWSALTKLTYLYCYSTSVGWSTTGAWSLDGCDIQFQDCSWTEDEVDDCLASLAGGPVTSCTIDISGNNEARTSASDADVAIINAVENDNDLTVNE